MTPKYAPFSAAKSLLAELLLAAPRGVLAEGRGSMRKPGEPANWVVPKAPVGRDERAEFVWRLSVEMHQLCESNGNI